MEVGGSCKKITKKTEKLMDEGHEFFEKENYRGAMQKYNDYLAFA